MKFCKLWDALQKAQEELEAQKAITAELLEKISKEEEEKDALRREKEKMTQKSQKLLQQLKEAKDQAAKTLSQHSMDYIAGMEDMKNKIERTRKALEWSKSILPKLATQLAYYKKMEQFLDMNRKTMHNIQNIVHEKRGWIVSLEYHFELLQKDLHEAKARECKKYQEGKSNIANFQNRVEKRRKELEKTKEEINRLKEHLDKNSKLCSSGEKWLCRKLCEENEDSAPLLENMEKMKAEMKQLRVRQARLEWRMTSVDFRVHEDGERSTGEASADWAQRGGGNDATNWPPTV